MYPAITIVASKIFHPSLKYEFYLIIKLNKPYS